jgi:hypothetical protein
MPRAVRATPLLVLDSRGENGGVGFACATQPAGGREREREAPLCGTHGSVTEIQQPGLGVGVVPRSIASHGMGPKQCTTNRRRLLSSVMVFLSAHAAAPHLNFLKQRRFGD